MQYVLVIEIKTFDTLTVWNFQVCPNVLIILRKIKRRRARDMKENMKFSNKLEILKGDCHFEIH